MEERIGVFVWGNACKKPSGCTQRLYSTPALNGAPILLRSAPLSPRVAEVADLAYRVLRAHSLFSALLRRIAMEAEIGFIGKR